MLFTGNRNKEGKKKKKDSLFRHFEPPYEIRAPKKADKGQQKIKPEYPGQWMPVQ